MTLGSKLLVCQYPRLSHVMRMHLGADTLVLVSKDCQAEAHSPYSRCRGFAHVLQLSSGSENCGYMHFLNLAIGHLVQFDALENEVQYRARKAAQPTPVSRRQNNQMGGNACNGTGRRCTHGMPEQHAFASLSELNRPL